MQCVSGFNIRVVGVDLLALCIMSVTDCIFNKSIKPVDEIKIKYWSGHCLYESGALSQRCQSCPLEASREAHLELL